MNCLKYRIAFYWNLSNIMLTRILSLACLLACFVNAAAFIREPVNSFLLPTASPPQSDTCVDEFSAFPTLYDEARDMMKGETLFSSLPMSKNGHLKYIYRKPYNLERTVFLSVLIVGPYISCPSHLCLRQASWVCGEEKRCLYRRRVYSEWWACDSSRYLRFCER